MTARFSSEDDRKYSKKNDPMSLNLYTYCVNNPIRYIDPSGHFATQTSNKDLYQSQVQIIEFLRRVQVQVEQLKRKNGLEDTNQEDKGIRDRFDIGKIIRKDTDNVINNDNEVSITVDNKDRRVDNIINLVVKQKDFNYATEKPEISNLLDSSDLQYNIVQCAIQNKDVPPPESGYVPPKGGPKWDKNKKGWLDKHGNVWVPDRKHGDHWDVQYPQGGYDNVYPDGKVREGDGPRGKFSPAQGPTPCPAPTPPPEESESGGDSSILENGDEIIGWGIIGSILFWVISETSRVLFPPRNLVPVP